MRSLIPAQSHIFGRTMKKAIAVFVLLAALAAGALPACTGVSSVNGSGNIVSREIKVDNFTWVVVEGTYTAEIQSSDTYSVTVSVDDNLLDRIVVEQEGQILRIAVKATATFFPTLLQAKITMPVLEGLYLAGAAKAAISGFKSSRNFETNLSGASSLNGYMEANDADFTLSGASKVMLKGAAKNMKLKASGASNLDLDEFVAGAGDIILSGASETTINISGLLSADLSGGSKLYYIGHPRLVNTRVSGGSTMEQK